MEFLIRTPECAFPTFILYPLGQRAEAHADFLQASSVYTHRCWGR